MQPTLEDVLVWLPFLLSLTVAFAAGFWFARLCQNRTMSPPPTRTHGRRSVRFWHRRHDEAAHATA